jgi:hypothetical protein
MARSAMMALWAPGLGGDLVITDPTRSRLLRFSARHTPAHREFSNTLSAPARPPWARELVGDLGDSHPHIGGINGQHARAASSEATATTSSSDNRRRSSGARGDRLFVVRGTALLRDRQCLGMDTRAQNHSCRRPGGLPCTGVRAAYLVAVGAAVVAIGAARYGFAAGRHKQVLDYSRRELSLG